MSFKTTYVLVEVSGVEDETAAESAIENLSNAEQSFHVVTTTTVTDEELEGSMGATIYFP